MIKKFEWYLEFVDLSYSPSETDIICTFRVEPSEGISLEEAAGRVASESSVGTWTTLYKLPDRIKKLMARVYKINGEKIEVAYPIDLFEPANIPQLLSSIAGNIFGMKAIKNLRLEDVKLPKEYVRDFKGPQFGLNGIREILKIKERPLTATVPKPKVGFSYDEYAKISYQAWIGGIDLVKDDENLTSQNFIKFEKRLKAFYLIAILNISIPYILDGINFSIKIRRFLILVVVLEEALNGQILPLKG